MTQHKKHTIREYEQTFLRKNPFFRVFLREIDRMSGSTIYLFTTLIGPLISFIILLSVFSSGVPHNIPAGVVDMDNSNLSRKISMWIGATQEVDVAMHFPNQEEAYSQMAEGKLDAVIIIPEGTEKNILKGVGQQVSVFINNTNLLKGGYLQKGIYKRLQHFQEG